jgi:hypothetical protein
MSIADNAPWSPLKLRRSGMFVRWVMESSNVRETSIDHEPPWSSPSPHPMARGLGVRGPLLSPIVKKVEADTRTLSGRRNFK